MQLHMDVIPHTSLPVREVTTVGQCVYQENSYVTEVTTVATNPTRVAVGPNVPRVNRLSITSLNISKVAYVPSLIIIK